MAYLPNIYKKGSVLYLKNGLPPILPGTSISPTGIPSYILTKEEGSYYYYDKTTSDARFVNSAGDAIEGEVYLVPKLANSARHFGVSYTTGDYTVKAGQAWKNASLDLIAYIDRVGTGDDSTLEMMIAKENGTAPTILTLKSDGTFNVNKTKSITNFGDVLTWSTGIKKNGDVIEGGTYEFRGGKFSLKSFTDVEGSFREVLVFDYLADGVQNVIDLKGNYIKGSGLTPTDNNHLPPKKYVDDADDALEASIDTLETTLTAQITALTSQVEDAQNSILKLKIRNFAGY